MNLITIFFCIYMMYKSLWRDGISQDSCLLFTYGTVLFTYCSSRTDFGHIAFLNWPNFLSLEASIYFAAAYDINCNLYAGLGMFVLLAATVYEHYSHYSQKCESIKGFSVREFQIFNTLRLGFEKRICFLYWLMFIWLVGQMLDTVLNLRVYKIIIYI